MDGRGTGAEVGNAARGLDCPLLLLWREGEAASSLKEGIERERWCTCMAIGVGVVYLAVLLLLSLRVCGWPLLPPSFVGQCKMQNTCQTRQYAHVPPMLLAQVPPRPTRP